ncbi:hypothetical protein VNO80_27524 [Phaseolus coccineus]|uniref:Uncharacterized protein n=1 Tax=Phaseolus coccineus TaxID=3886 RepID=A0AAN9LGI0_PHACN
MKEKKNGKEFKRRRERASHGNLLNRHRVCVNQNSALNSVTVRHILLADGEFYLCDHLSCLTDFKVLC